MGGLVVMSSDLESMAESLYTNQVPAMWVKQAYPSLKPLAAWIDDLQVRIQFVKEWIDDGKPATYWISGFFFPQAYLTGTLQNFARKYTLSIDTVDFDYNVLKKTPEELHGKPPEDGCYIHGLFLEGAAWDPNQHALVEARPKELYSTFPPIWLFPKVDRQLTTEGIYCCPRACSPPPVTRPTLCCPSSCPRWSRVPASSPNTSRPSPVTGSSAPSPSSARSTSSGKGRLARVNLRGVLSC